MAQRCRTVVDLQWVEKVPSSPWPKARLKGLAADGKRYENAIAKALPGAWHGHWFHFQDKNGLGYCSPDLIFVHQGTLWVVEVKLSLVQEAFFQLSNLYLPVVSKFYGVEAKGLVITKYIGRGWQGLKPASTLKEALAEAQGVLLAPITLKTHLKLQMAL